MKRNTTKRTKIRTTISMDKAIHGVGVKMAKLENRDFSGMLATAIAERWNARKAKAA